MKKLFSLSVVAFTFAIQGIAVAQQQGTPITEEEYNVVIASVCEASASATPADILSAVASKADSSMSSEEITELQELAIGMFSMPSVEKTRLCEGGELAS